MNQTITKIDQDTLQYLLETQRWDVKELADYFKAEPDEVEAALAEIGCAQDSLGRYHIAETTPEQKFRDRYGFTPNREQMQVLQSEVNSLVFARLERRNHRGIGTIAKATGLTEPKVKKAIKQLKKTELAQGEENAFLKPGWLEEIEQHRVELLAALTSPMSVTDWIEPFETEYNQTQISSAIALLAQEELIEYKDGKYVRVTNDDQSNDYVNGDAVNDDQLNICDNHTAPIPKATLNRVRTDGGTQPRTELNEAVIAEYAEQMREGVKFPPITVYFDGASYWLADGFHRYWAASRAEVEIDIEVINGSLRNAILHSVGANASHGLRRSNEDKRKAVVTLLQDNEWSQWSDRAIARQCQVSNRFVSNMRKELSVNGSQIENEPTQPKRKVQRGDQVYEQKVRTTEPKANTEPVYDEASEPQVQVEPACEEVNEPQPSESEAKPSESKSAIPSLLKYRTDILNAVCQFLQVEQPNPTDFAGNVFVVPDDFEVAMTRLFYNLETGKAETAIAAISNDAAAQNETRDKAQACCLVGDSKSFCAIVLLYFGREVDRFLATFCEFGVVSMLGEADAN